MPEQSRKKITFRHLFCNLFAKRRSRRETSFKHPRLCLFYLCNIPKLLRGFSVSHAHAHNTRHIRRNALAGSQKYFTSNKFSIFISPIMKYSEGNRFYFTVHFISSSLLLADELSILDAVAWFCVNDVKRTLSQHLAYN